MLQVTDSLKRFHSFCRNTFVLQTLVQTSFCLLFYNVCQPFAILYSGLNKMWRKNYSPFVILRLERHISALIIFSSFFVFPTLSETGLRPRNGCALSSLTCQHQSVTTQSITTFISELNRHISIRITEIKNITIQLRPVKGNLKKVDVIDIIRNIIALIWIHFF